MPSALRPADRQLAWQLTAVGLLTELLTQAAGKGLPVVVREVGEVGPELLGYCQIGLSQKRRQTFDAWHSYLGAVQPADRLDEYHVAELTVLMAHWNRYQGVGVTLRCEFTDDERDERW